MKTKLLLVLAQPQIYLSGLLNVTCQVNLELFIDDLRLTQGRVQDMEIIPHLHSPASQAPSSKAVLGVISIGQSAS